MTWWSHYNGAKCPQSLYQCQCPACRCQAVQLNKWVLRLDLNNCSHWRFLIFSGSWFHASGADTANDSEICLSPDNDEVTALEAVEAIVVHFCHWQLTQADKSLQGTAVQDNIKPCRPADRVSIVFSVQQATNEADHTAHDWCDQTYSVHGWVIQRCSSLPAACWVDTEALQPVNSHSQCLGTATTEVTRDSLLTSIFWNSRFFG